MPQVPPLLTLSARCTDMGSTRARRLEPDELRRYSRHLILPEVGVQGQERLKEARVLIVGAGGLGSPLALYLGAAGVGTLGMVDGDVVDASNLQRQVLHSTAAVGRPKLDSAIEHLRALNPHVTVVPYRTFLNRDNALEILRDYDVVVDGTDNFATRYLVNDACVLLGKPNVYGSVYRFEGQASVFWAEHGPCYRCLFEEPPPPGSVPSCAEGGVLGILPGLIGLIQASEVLKLLLGVGEPLLGRLLLVDVLGMEFRELSLQKNPDCALCGEAPRIRELVDYEAFCGTRSEAPPAPADELTPEALLARLESAEPPWVLDVRSHAEWDIVHLKEARCIPLLELSERLRELDRTRPGVVLCHHGVRSLRALKLLKEAGFTQVQSLAGGIDAYAQQVAPSLPRY